VGENSFVTISDSSVQYCGFDSLIYIDTNEKEFLGHYEINNSKFIGIIGYEGSILNIKEINDKATVTFNNSIFRENFSMYRGAVVYSQSNSANLYVSFNNCVFKDNISIYGINIK